ncbi:MAG TPA: GIY-YIG nuclease family protein [Candidatus Nanopusillus sp.]|nr:GIY-YIG nuclease family protein [Candidatus Nanopusillus sp.]
MDKGSYLLLIFLPKDIRIPVGSLKNVNFKRGYYIYVGSALNSLTGRVKRHLTQKDKYHWHIDYLLDHSDVKSVILIPSSRKIECLIAQQLTGEIIMEKFGSTDCKCKSHLFYYRDLEKALNEILTVLKTILKSNTISPCQPYLNHKCAL